MERQGVTDSHEQHSSGFEPRAFSFTEIGHPTQISELFFLQFKL